MYGIGKLGLHATAAYRVGAGRVVRIAIERESREFVVRQIADVLARRMVCRVQPGEALSLSFLKEPQGV